MYSLTVLNDSSELIHYNDPLIPLYAVTGNLKCFHKMRAMPHWHNDVEFLLPLHGYLTYRVNNRDYFVNEHEAIFVNSRQMHFGCTTDGTDCVYLCIVFPPSLLFANAKIYQKYVDCICDNSIPEAFVIHGDQEEEKEILSLLQQIYQIYNEKQDCYELFAVNSLVSLWISLYHIVCKNGSAPVVPAKNSSDTITQKQMLQFVQANYFEKLSLKAIADSGNISRTKCCQLFARFLNQTPVEYLTQYRLEQSIRLLRETSLSATEIAYQCGFNSSSYFAETFKKYKGCSPLAFRKMC